LKHCNGLGKGAGSKEQGGRKERREARRGEVGKRNEDARGDSIHPLVRKEITSITTFSTSK
jgi:hypothetical protein